MLENGATNWDVVVGDPRGTTDLERIADTLNCDFSYAFVPRENIDDIIYNQAKKKAQKILDKVNKNMGLENQLVKTDDLLKDIIEELLDGNIARIWDEDE